MTGPARSAARGTGALRWLAGGVCGATVLLALAYAVVFKTADGRAWVQGVVETQLARTLAGKVSLGTITDLGTHGLTLRNVAVLDPSGTSVLTAEHLRVTLAPGALLDGELRLETAHVRNAQLDLDDPSAGGSQRGLVAAFTPLPSPDEGPEPGDDTDSAALRISISSIVLDDVSVRARIPPLGELATRSLRARGSFRLDDTLRVGISSLTTTLVRDGHPVGEITRAEGEYVLEGAPSRVQLEAQIGTASLSVEAHGPLPGDPLFAKSPVMLTVTARGVDGRVATTLGLDDPAPGLATPLDLALDVRGTGAAPHGSLALESAAGSARVQADLAADGQAQLDLVVSQLALARLYEGLPDATLDLGLSAAAEPHTPDGARPLRVRLRRGTLAGHDLPEVHAQAHLLEGRLSKLDVRARGHGGTLTFDGQANLAGSLRGRLAVDLPSLARLPPIQARRAAGDVTEGRLSLRARVSASSTRVDANGSLTLRDLAVPDLAVAAADGQFTVAGDPARPRIDALLAAKRLRSGRIALDRLRLEVVGGPTRYHATASTHFPAGSVHAELDLERERHAVQVALTARGVVRGKRFSLALESARIGGDGSLGVRGLSAHGLGQNVALSGKYGRRGAEDVVLRVDGIDLALVSEVLELSPPLVGKARARATASGTLATPIVELSFRGHGLGLAQAPADDPADPRPMPKARVTIDASIDARAGEATLEAQVESGARLALRFAGDATFDRSRHASWARRLATADLNAMLALARFDSHVLDPFLPEPLPRRAAGNATFHLEGPAREPKLEAKGHLQVREATAGRDAEATLRATYEAGTARAAVRISDPDGTWLDASASLTHPEGSLAAIVRDPTRLAHSAAYDARVSVSPRKLANISPSAPPPDPAASAILSGTLELTHEPSEEPEATLSAQLESPPDPARPDSCMGLPAQLALEASMAEGELNGHMSVKRNGTELMSARGNAQLALIPTLRTQARPQVTQVSGSADLHDVELATLPFTCDLVHGQLSGTARATGLLTEHPEVFAQLSAKRLSLDRRHFIDAKLLAKAKLPRADFDLRLAHDETTSRIRARLPLALDGGGLGLAKDQPLSGSARLHRLPIGALVPPGGAVSRVAGILNGRLRLFGTGGKPKLRGHLAPRGVGFTATSIAQPLSDINGRIDIVDRMIVIERLSASDGDGTLSLQGRLLDITDRRRPKTTVTLEAKQFPLRQQGRVAGTVDTRVAIQGTLTEEWVRIKVALDDTSIWLRGGNLRDGIDLDPHPDIVDPRMDLASQSAELEPDEDALPLRLTLSTQESVWVRRDDFAVRLTMDLIVESRPEGATVKGPVVLNRGYIQLIGRVFDLDDRSRIQFVGSEPANPVLDILANTEVRRSGDRVSVRISGRARSPELTFLLNGSEVSAAQAAEQLFGGGGASGAAAAQAQSVVSGIVGGVMAMSARKELGDVMPILMVEPGDETQGGRVRAGFELDSLVPGFLENVIRGVYVEGIIASGSEQQNQDTQGGVLLELYLPHDLVTSGQYGPGETWSVDLGWEP